MTDQGCALQVVLAFLSVLLEVMHAEVENNFCCRCVDTMMTLMMIQTINSQPVCPRKMRTSMTRMIRYK